MNKEIEEVCKKNGLDFQLIENGILITKSKDPWYGVEYVEATKNLTSFTIGKIYKVQTLENDVGDIGVFFDDRMRTNNGMHKSNFKPSTESAYIDQLKKEAFERFGEIKEGDRFKTVDGYNVLISFNGYSKELTYQKESDILFIGGLWIYRQGKWATKVKERISGKYVRSHIIWPNENGSTLGFSFSGFANKEGLLPIEKLDDAGQFLAQQLEKYLNNEL